MNTKKSLFASFTAAALLLPFAVSAVDPYNDEFEDKRIEAYVSNTWRMYEDAFFKDVPGMTGKKCIGLTFDNEQEAEFHTVPVSDSSSYTLSFRGQWDNTETYDNNPTFEAAVDDTWRYGLNYLPAITINFLDADEKPIKDEIFMTMPYGKWREYKHVFLPPDGAAFMKLKIRSGRNPGTFYIDNLKLKSLSSAADETVMSFSSSSSDISGSIYGFKLPNSLRKTDDGKFLVSPAYGASLPALKVQGGAKYRLEFKGQVFRDKGGASNIMIHFLDVANKKIGEVSSTKHDKEAFEFSVPKEATKMKLIIYNNLLDEIKISKLK